MSELASFDWNKLKDSTEDLVGRGLRAYAGQNYEMFYLNLGELMRRVERRAARGRPANRLAVHAVRWLSYLVVMDQQSATPKPAERAARVVMFLEGPEDATESVEEVRGELLSLAARESNDASASAPDREAGRIVYDLIASTPERWEVGWCHLCWPDRSRAIPGDMVCREHS